MIALGPLGLGAAIGLVLGLLGGGGAILAVPGLVYLLGVEPHAAIAASLAIVAVGALTGLGVHARQGRVAWSTALQLGAAGMAGSVFGARLGQLMPGERLLALLGVFMLVAAWLMVRRPTASAAPAARPFWQTPAIGLVIGVLTGFFGVGGGFLILPALTLLIGLPIHLAIGTSLAVIAMNALAGVGGYVGGDINWGLTLLVSAGAAIGALVGGRLAGALPERALRRGFAVMVAGIALYLVYRNGLSLVTALLLPGLAS